MLASVNISIMIINRDLPLLRGLQSPLPGELWRWKVTGCNILIPTGELASFLNPPQSLSLKAFSEVVPACWYSSYFLGEN